jgi:hypothetical protein
MHLPQRLAPATRRSNMAPKWKASLSKGTPEGKKTCSEASPPNPRTPDEIVAAVKLEPHEQEALEKDTT